MMDQHTLSLSQQLATAVTEALANNPTIAEAVAGFWDNGLRPTIVLCGDVTGLVFTDMGLQPTLPATAPQSVVPCLFTDADREMPEFKGINLFL